MTTEDNARAAERGDPADRFDWTDFDRLLDEFKMPDAPARRPVAAAGAGKSNDGPLAAADADRREPPAGIDLPDFEKALAEELPSEPAASALASHGTDAETSAADDEAADGETASGGDRWTHRSARELLARLGSRQARFAWFAGHERLVGGTAFVLLLLAGTSFGVAYLAPSDEAADSRRQARLDDRSGTGKEAALAGVFDAPTLFAAPERAGDTHGDIAVRVVRTEKVSARIIGNEPSGSAAPASVEPSSPGGLADVEAPAGASANLAALRETGPDERDAAGASAAIVAADRAPAPAKEGDAEIERLLEQGRTLMESGNIASARLLFERVIEAGDPRGARAMGMTFDPAIHARLPVAGLAADDETARSWYAKAIEMAGKSTPSSASRS